MSYKSQLRIFSLTHLFIELLPGVQHRLHLMVYLHWRATTERGSVLDPSVPY